MTNKEAIEAVGMVRGAGVRTWAGVTVGRAGPRNKHQQITLYGRQANEVATWLEARGFVRTPLSGTGESRLKPIVMDKASSS